MKRPHFATLLQTFAAHGVEHVLACRTAGRLRRADVSSLPLGGEDEFVDLCYRQVWNNCECLSRALEELEGRPVLQTLTHLPLTGALRSSDRPLRVRWSAGILNLLPRIPGLGTYDDLCAETAEVAIEGLTVRALSPRQLVSWVEASCAATGKPIPPAEEALREAARRRAVRWLDLGAEADLILREDISTGEDETRS